VTSLPDDDPGTMTILCKFLHYQNEPFPGLVLSPSISTLRNLAIMSDKYNCVGSVGFLTDAWIDRLETLETKASDDELFRLVESAYILDHAFLFERVTKRILMNDLGGILDRMIGWSADEILPIKVYGM
jgi:hypothetical protein